jgi:cbb3-type cytochrome c oxidase subunit I/cbb3-type cytochrome c oxidase subunit II
MDTEELVNKSLVKHWASWALVWLTIFPLVGLLISIKFHEPDFLGGISWLTFGRMRPVHVNGVIFGAFSTSFIALLYYYVPRLCGVRMYKEEWGWWLLWIWNAFVFLGSISFLMGYNSGLEAGEYEWPLNILRFIVLLLITVQLLGTIFRRKEKRFYVALWYTTAAFIWTLFNLILGNVILKYVEAFSGVNSAAMHGLYIHYIVGLWLTPAGLATIYYFIPVSTKNPLFSHRLSLLGFWSLAFFYPFVGIHHYLYSPIPHMNQTIAITTSMMLIIPVWAVTINFFGTMVGRWGAVAGGGGDNYGAKFLILGAIYYFLGCFQGSTEALRRVQQLTHFNDFVISHSHLTVFGAMVVWTIGGLYYIWPRVIGRQLWSDRLASWHLWLTITGFTVMAVVLAAMGFIQGSMLEYGVNFVDTVKEMKPWWAVRSLAGLTMDIGFVLLVINFYKTAREGKPLEKEQETSLWAKDTPVQVEGAKGSWIETPSTVFLAAGVGFFSLAVFVQGIIPWLMPETRTTTVIDEVTKKPIQVSDYTPLELRGRQIYVREGCWYCHSQYVRPVTGESLRWGPVSQAGEYAYDFPHLFSTRRIGPDLTRVGRKYADGWHIAHHWNPRHVVPDSIMPSFPWLFEPVKGNETPQLNEDGKALVAYVQKLGTGIGDWREDFAPTHLASGVSLHMDPEERDQLVAYGKTVYERRCIGCHGEKGDSQGPSAVFFETKPRDFTRGIFKFRSTPGKDSLPTDADLFITVTHGLWGTPMPTWEEISERERFAVIQYIKTFSDRWKKEEVGVPITVTSESPVTLASIQNGDKLFHSKATCFICHGADGKGDGPLAAALKDVWNHSIRPANFTLPAGVQGGVKLGHDGEHIFKTVMAGVGGTPMPPFQGQLTPDEVWDIVHYEQSLRVKAHESELIAAGLRDPDRADALSRIWQSLSVSASQGKIEQAVLEQELAELKSEEGQMIQARR